MLTSEHPVVPGEVVVRGLERNGWREAVSPGATLYLRQHAAAASAVTAARLSMPGWQGAQVAFRALRELSVFAAE